MRPKVAANQEEEMPVTTEQGKQVFLSSLANTFGTLRLQSFKRLNQQVRQGEKKYWKDVSVIHNNDRG